jgi:hypothetical protein
MCRYLWHLGQCQLANHLFLVTLALALGPQLLLLEEHQSPKHQMLTSQDKGLDETESHQSRK